ncbi:hypothetical protein B566_EDAN003140 [Ephemera danica]|nr:hypothetical protein B566_EDAN003140 [Ephemera danica]
MVSRRREATRAERAYAHITADNPFNKLSRCLGVLQARLTPLRLLNMAIGDEGRTRPVRVKWKPHKKKDRTAIQRVIDECEKNGAFNSTEMALLMASAASARSWQPERPQETEKETPTKHRSIKETVEKPCRIKMERIEARDETTGEEASTSINSYADLMGSVAKTEPKSYAAKPLVYTVGPPIMDEDTIEMMFNPRLGKNHRDMEKIRRKELAHRFKILASLLVPVDMLNRCSKITVLQRALQEVERLKRRGKKYEAQRLSLEHTRDQLLQSFSKVCKEIRNRDVLKEAETLGWVLQGRVFHLSPARSSMPLAGTPEKQAPILASPKCEASPGSCSVSSAELTPKGAGSNSASPAHNLRHPSERRPSKLFLDEDFDCSGKIKGNNQVTKPLKVHLERIPDEHKQSSTSPQHMPMLQPYTFDPTESAASSDSDSAPPPLLPEVTVTKLQQKTCDTDVRVKLTENLPSLASLAEEEVNKRHLKHGTNKFKLGLDLEGDSELNDLVKGTSSLSSVSVASPFSDHEKHSEQQHLYGSDIGSDSEWSDSLEGLFQEPERISTGKEEKVTIDGVDFLSFESKEDLLEFTEMDVDYINSYKTVDIEETSRNHQPIIPTKTKDITKIKGWRNKLFAGHNYSVENETPTLKSTGKDIVSSPSKTVSVSSDSNKVVHSVTDVTIKDNLHEAQEKSTKSDGNSSKVEDGKKCSPVKESNSLQEHTDSAQHSNLDESWVKFAVSALVLPSPGEAGKSGERNTPGRSTEGETSEEEIRKRGRPINFPLSRYMQKKLGTEQKQRKTPKLQAVVENNRKIMQSVKNTVKSLVQNVETNEVDSKIIETSEMGKEKTSRELKKLGHVVIDIENKLKSPNKKTSTDESNCTEEFCKLGCVCASLDTVPRPLGHCGKVDCMFECTCTTLPNVAVERMIEDEKRDLAPAEKEFRNTLIRADNGIMMVKERGRREIKLPGRFRSSDMLVGEALTAIEHKVFRGRGPNKPKISKENSEEPPISVTKCEETVKRERKSLLKEIRSPPWNVPAKKSFEHNTSIPIPSPEMLIDPHSDETFDIEFCNDAPKSSLYDNEGGFISLDMEEKFLASQVVQIKQEKMDDDDGTIEIDDMGWQSYIPEPTNHKSAEVPADDFGKIVDIKSVALEEFCIDSDAPSTSTADAVTPDKSSTTQEENQPSTSNSNVDKEQPTDKRKAAKLRAKRLAEFFTTNANVSSLVKSAFVFNPSVLQKEAITLLQWCSLKERYKERSIQLWIKNTQRDFHFLVTESAEVPASPEYTNLWDYKITESSDIPEVAKQMQQDDANTGDYQRCCILWCNGKNWEFIGTLMKNKPNNSTPLTMILPSSKPKSFSNHTSLPKDIIETKWYSITLKSDFESLRLINENVLISYSKINQVIGAAWRFKKTMFIEMTRLPPSDFSYKAPFGLYAKPNEYKTVFIGPYSTEDEAILEFVPYEKVLCKSSFSELFLEPLGTRKLITPPIASFTEPELVFVPNRRVSLESRTSCSSTDYRSDESPKRQEVTSSGRVRKIPKYFIQECEEEISKPPSNRGRKRKIPQHLLDCETPTIAKCSEKRPRDKSESPATKKARQLETFSKNMDGVFNNVLKNHYSEVKIKQEVVTSDDENSDGSIPLVELMRRRREQSAPATQTKNTPSSETKRRTKNRIRVNRILIQEGTLAELICHYESLKAIPVVVFSNGSVRMRNPFGKRVAHFENLDLAKRFLNFVFNKAVKGTALTWTIQPWSGCQEKGKLIQETLQTARL